MIQITEAQSKYSEDLRRVRTRMDSDQHKIWNEKMAILYDPDAFITKSGFLIRWVEGMRLDAAREALNLSSAHFLLDIGCGAGNFLQRLNGTRAVGIDLSDDLLGKAHKRLRLKKNIRLISGDAERLPFEGDTFDAIVCSEVLEHVLDPTKVLAEICRVAKPGAQIVITVPNESLINWIKRFVLFFGLKRWIAGDYSMSDNMLDEWHLSEITPSWVDQNSHRNLNQTRTIRIPSPVFPVHRIFVFQVAK